MRGRPFQKGHKLNIGNKYRLGQTVSQETKEKMSKSQKGKKRNPMSAEQKEQIRLWHLGRKQSPETIAKRFASRFGYRHSPETRKKIGRSNSGSKSNLWRGGISPLNESIRKSVEYKLWREAVYTRDNWTCVFCGQEGGILNADHIKPFAYYPELRFAIDNGRTLCAPCHRKTPTYGGGGSKDLTCGIE